MTIEHLGRIARHLTGLMALAALALACGEPGPCPGVEKCLRVEIEVQGLNDRSLSQAECDEAWGFPAGAIFTATIVQLRGEESCKSGMAEVEGLDEWDWELQQRTGAPGGETLHGEYLATDGDCSARIGLRLVTQDGPDCDAAAGDDCRLYINAEPIPGPADKCPYFCGFVLDVSAHTL